MTQTDWTVLSLHLAAMLATAVALGSLARRLGIPAVVGEIAGGLVLGPTMLGRLAPDLFAWLFPPTGPVASARGRPWSSCIPAGCRRCSPMPRT